MKPNDHKAYAAYLEKYNLKPTLYAYPVMYVVHRDGSVEKKLMQDIYHDLGWSLNTVTGRWSKGKAKKETT